MLTIHDTVPATMMDLSSQFFLREKEVSNKANRYYISFLMVEMAVDCSRRRFCVVCIYVYMYTI